MPPLSTLYLQLYHPIPPFAPKFNQPTLPHFKPIQSCLKHRDSNNPITRTTNTPSIPIRSKRKSVPRNESSETEELVRVLLKNFNEKRPLISTLNKHVKFITTEHCFLLFEELGKRDSWLQCLEVFRWMQKQRWYIPDNGVYSKLISVMGKKGQTRMAMWLFSEMRNSGCRPDTSVYNALITAHLRSKDKTKALAKAIGYFEKMKGIERCKPNIVTYNILLRAYAQARDVNQVNALFKDLGESIVSPDIYTYNGVMDAFGKNGMVREMEDVLARMKSNQTKADIITFNLLIDSYGRRQAFDKMEEVFKSLLRSKERPTLPTFNSMILNYGKARLKDKAEFVFKKMTTMGYTPSYVTYESLITTYGFCDCVSKARGIFDDMMESKMEIPISSLNAMLDVYCLNGLPTEADLLFEHARNSGLLPDATTYKLLYKAYTKANMNELIEKLQKYMDKDGIIPNKKFFLEALGAHGTSKARSESGRIASGSRSSETTSRSASSLHSSKITSRSTNNSPSKEIISRSASWSRSSEITGQRASSSRSSEITSRRTSNPSSSEITSPSASSPSSSGITG